MAVESEEFTELGDEFALIAETAAEAGAVAGGAQALRREKGVQVITIPGGGADVVATQPAALAAALDQLLTTQQLTTEPEGRR